jgi:hypothetical protein
VRKIHAESRPYTPQSAALRDLRNPITGRDGLLVPGPVLGQIEAD